MARRIKRIIAVILMGVMLVGILSFLFGCKGIHSDPWKYKEEDQGFYYYVSGKGDKDTPPF